MVGSHFRSKSGQMPEADERLMALLRQWKGVEPTCDFEAAVWRKIQSVTATDVCQGSRIERFRGWMPMRPAWATAAAAAAALIVGAGIGFLSPRPLPAHPTHPLLQSQTMAGAYVHVATGGSR